MLANFDIYKILKLINELYKEIKHLVSVS